MLLDLLESRREVGFRDLFHCTTPPPLPHHIRRHGAANKHKLPMLLIEITCIPLYNLLNRGVKKIYFKIYFYLENLPSLKFVLYSLYKPIQIVREICLYAPSKLKNLYVYIYGTAKNSIKVYLKFYFNLLYFIYLFIYYWVEILVGVYYIHTNLHVYMKL